MASKHTERIFIRNARLSFPALAEPRESMKGKGDLKYQATFILDKDSPCVDQIRAATARIAQAEFKDKAKQVLANTDKLPLKDGDRRSIDGYEGKLYVKASSLYPPDLIDANPRHKITDPKEIADKFQAGFRVNGYIDLFPYDVPAARGISASLVSVQFAAYDDTFGGAVKPEESAYPDCSDQAAASSASEPETADGITYADDYEKYLA